MPDAPSFQQRFAEVLGGGDEAVTPWLADPSHIVRLHVYRNNVVTAWADALRKNYPTVERLVGAEFMKGLVVAFTKEEQPTSPVLALYGKGFAEFVEQFQPAAKLPYLADVARLDRAWTESLFAENAPVLKPEALAGFKDDAMATLALRLHPSVSVARSNWNAHDVWQANRLDNAPPKVRLVRDPSAALIWRSPEGMDDRKLSVAETLFIERIEAGACLSDALSNGDEKSGLAFFSEALARGVFAATDKRESKS